MAKNKKYQCVVEKEGTAWLVQIVRQVTSKKTIVTKQQGGFASEQEAMVWGEEALQEFTAKQSTSNKRHGAQRKKNDEIKRQRSSRRADKTAAQKAEKAALKPLLDADSSTVEGDSSAEVTPSPKDSNLR